MAITVIPTTEDDLTVPIRRKIWGSHNEGTDGIRVASAMLTYQVDWDDRWEFVRQVNGKFATGPLRMPMQYPDLPGILVSACSNMRGLGNNIGGAIAEGASCPSPYKYALVDVSFRTPEYAVDGDTALLDLNYSAGGQFLTCPSGVYAFGDGTKADTGVGVFVASTNINITRFRVESLDTDTFEACQGRVNSTTFFGRDAGTALCSPITTNTQVNIYGTSTTNVTYSFAWRSIPWNWFLHPSTGAWGIVSPAPYSSTDLNVLFT